MPAEPRRWPSVGLTALARVLEPPKPNLSSAVAHLQTDRNQRAEAPSLLTRPGNLLGRPPQRLALRRLCFSSAEGGAWERRLQFYPECAHFAAKGMVAISADYRIASVQHSTPFESVADAKSAIRFVRQHAAELGIDPQRIVARWRLGRRPSCRRNRHGSWFG